MLDRNSRIFVAGHQGMVGSAIARRLDRDGFSNVVTRAHGELDLIDQAAVRGFFGAGKLDAVVLAAARVGGIWANNEYPAEFIYDNLMIEANVIHQAFLHGVQRLLFLGSSCIYPRLAEQPMGEAALLSGPLEPTNEPYAVAKIAGVKLCESYNRQYGTDYRSVLPTNLYGPGDTYHDENSHVIPALIKRFHEAKVAGRDKVAVWGTGSVRREFLNVDDLAAACVYVLGLDAATLAAHTSPMQSHVNVGYGQDMTVKDLAEAVRETVGYRGEIVFDRSKPDGAPRKLLDSSLIERLGWRPIIDIKSGLADAYRDFLERIAS